MRVVRGADDAVELIAAARREAAAAFGDGTLYVEKLHRTAAPRRAAGVRRRLRQRRASLRARVLAAAPPSEGRRGESFPGAGAGGARAHGRGRDRRGQGCRLPQRRHDRVPARRRGRRGAVLLPRDEHTAAGRTSGHRGCDRRRSGEGPTGGCRRGAAAVGAGVAAAARARHRVPDLCGGSLFELPATGRSAAALSRALRAGHPRRRRRRRGRRDRRQLRSRCSPS